jgi:hypothetical protein
MGMLRVSDGERLVCVQSMISVWQPETVLSNCSERAEEQKHSRTFAGSRRSQWAGAGFTQEASTMGKTANTQRENPLWCVSGHLSSRQCANVSEMVVCPTHTFCVYVCI